MVDFVYYLTNLFIFDISLLYYYINLTSSIVFRLFSWDKHLSQSISLWHPGFSVSVPPISELICGKLLETFVILLAILLSIK